MLCDAVISVVTGLAHNRVRTGKVHRIPTNCTAVPQGQNLYLS